MRILETRRTAIATAALVAAVAAAAGTTGAAAAGGKPFDLTTAKGGNGGQAHGYGKIAFSGPKKVKVTGRINDMCPGDGYGAYIEFKVNFVGGGYGTTVRSDEKKCKARNGVGYSFTKSFPRKVKSVGVTVIELDRATGGTRVGDAARVLVRR
ncbi:hypothetical protein DSM112329_03980 [Paraconexibacter sp. AEG42_29]|uniref:DUF5666 domain-containing protein n=1 Tax=Paraconexibacter sp. AEG42_29 TaxID=2997339 RepID=A0AAU7AZQ9_9ACTN